MKTYSDNPNSVRSRLREERKRAGLKLLQEWVPADKLDACKAAVAEIVRRITEGEDE
jgi:hypothetical protein